MRGLSRQFGVRGMVILTAGAAFCGRVHWDLKEISGFLEAICEKNLATASSAVSVLAS